MKTLKEFAKSKSNFVSIKAGESYIGIYRGFKLIEKESFGEIKEYARYLIEDLEDKVIRNLDSQSAALANQMDSVAVDQIIKISREGEGTSTKYKIEVVDKGIKEEETPSDEDIPVVEDEKNT